MEPGVLLMTSAVAMIVIGLVALRIYDAWSDLAPLWEAWTRRRHAHARQRPSTVSDDGDNDVMSRTPEPRADTSTDTSTIPPSAKAPYPHLTEREVVLWLAGLKTADTWRYSANKIYALVGGHRNEVMGWVRTVRGDEPAAPPDDEVVTPIAGRRTRASYYPGEPELEYQEPEVR